MLNKRHYSRSSRWFQKYFMDRYTQQARKQKLRSRSWFKLQAIDHLDSLFYSGMTVLDLGSSPGGWSSYVSKKIGNFGNVIACDLLPMKKIPRVNFFQEDCSNPGILEKLYLKTKYQKVQIVLSDMSPKISGIPIIDINKSIYLGNVALDICRCILISGGSFVVKIFQGEDFDNYLYNVRSLFSVVKVRKPNASRFSSREVYIVAKNLIYK